MSSVVEDVKNKRTRQSAGEQPAAAPVEPVAPDVDRRPVTEEPQPVVSEQAAEVTPQNVERRPGWPSAAPQFTTPAVEKPMDPQPQVVQPQAQEPANRPVGDQANARVIAGGASVTPAVATAPAEPAVPKQMTYTDLYKELYKPMTPEEKAAQQKRQRNRQIINAVGDGISALANLYYTNESGVNAYDPSTSLTKAAKERYDKILAQQHEDEERRKAMAYNAGAADIEMAYRRAKDAAAEKTAAAAAKQAQDNWDAQFEYTKERDKATEKRAAETAAFRREQLAATTAYKNAVLSGKSTEGAKKAVRDLYGKRTVHGVKGHAIYDRVWNGSWPEVYSYLVAQNAGKGDKSDRTYREEIAAMSLAERQKFVDAHYKDYPEAVKMMEIMAADTPERYIKNMEDESWNGWNDSNDVDEDFE